MKAAQVVKLRRAKTLNGAYIRIGVKGNRVYLNRTTRVTKTDIGASNGTIHVIDGVHIPPATSRHARASGRLIPPPAGRPSERKRSDLKVRCPTDVLQLIGAGCSTRSVPATRVEISSIGTR